MHTISDRKSGSRTIGNVGFILILTIIFATWSQFRVFHHSDSSAPFRWSEQESFLTELEGEHDSGNDGGDDHSSSWVPIMDHTNGISKQIPSLMLSQQSTGKVDERNNDNVAARSSDEQGSNRMKDDDSNIDQRGEVLPDPSDTHMDSSTSNNHETAASQNQIASTGESNMNITSENKGTAANHTIPTTNFTRYDSVAIVTKVLWPKDIKNLERWLCYISHAYNDKMKYDVIVFTTMPWEEKDIVRLQNVAAHVNVTVALEGPSLEEQLAAMTKEEVKFLRNRCGLNDTDDRELTWTNYCSEPNSRHYTNLGYSW